MGHLTTNGWSPLRGCGTAAGILAGLLGFAGCGDDTSMGPNSPLAGNVDTTFTGGGMEPAAGGLQPITGGLLGTGGGGAGGMAVGSGGVPMAGMDPGVTGGIMADAGFPDAGMGDAGMDTAPPPAEDLGEGDGQDVITIGDSWMSAFVQGIQQSLVALTGRDYRTYGVGGTRLLNEQIPGQYENAKREDPDILTVVMTGGGNDIIQVPGLRDDCDAEGDLCGEEVGKILDRLSALWAEMATDGVRDVIYVQYSTPEGEDVDFELPDGDGVQARCAAVPPPLRCHQLVTVDLVDDLPDGIHPSAAGYDAIAEAVYDMMVDRGMRR